jgi:ribosomal protein S18 acetylase RimI-like enzyme
METIKPINRKDIETLCDWHKEHVAINFPDSIYKRDLFKEKILADLNYPIFSLMVKLVNKKKMIGWLWLKKEFDIYKNIWYCDLHYIHIAPKYRGRNFGESLVKLTEKWAVKNSCKEIRLGTDANNQASIALYEKCGFVKKRILFEKKLCQPKRKHNISKK